MATIMRLQLALILAAPLAAAASEAGPIQDNSFLIEEAYNQEHGVIQHINTFQRSLRPGGAWTYTFTEEWPLQGQTHQASVTFAMAGTSRDPGTSGIGDLALNYRWQALGNGDAVVAFAPRLTLLLPTGDASRGLGNGGAGVQANIPVSVVLSKELVTHVNVGGTYIPSAWVGPRESAPLTSFAAGQSLVWLTHHHVNVLLEVLYTRTDLRASAGSQRFESLIVNPGVRLAFDFASGLQVVPGVGVPIGIGPSQGELGMFFYLSLEHPFAGAAGERS